MRKVRSDNARYPYAIELRIPSDMAARVREISGEEMVPESTIIRRLAMVGLRQHDSREVKE